MGVTWESHGTYYGLSTNALYGAIDILPGVRLSSWVGVGEEVRVVEVAVACYLWTEEGRTVEELVFVF